MDIVWSYCLIGIITLVLLIIRIINSKLLERFMQTYPTCKKYIIFKKDFFYTIARLATVCTIIINSMTLYGHSRLNGSSIIMTLFLVIMCMLSGISFIAIDEEKHFNIGGYTIEEDHIKDIKIKEGKKRLTCTILFKEEMNGYQGMEFYIIGKKMKEFITQIQ